MPCVPKAPDAHDRVVNIPPLNPMLHSELPCCRLTDDEVRNPQRRDHDAPLYAQPSLASESLLQAESLHDTQDALHDMQTSTWGAGHRVTQSFHDSECRTDHRQKEAGATTAY